MRTRIAAVPKSDEGWLFAAGRVGMQINPARSEQPGAAPKVYRVTPRRPKNMALE